MRRFFFTFFFAALFGRSANAQSCAVVEYSAKDGLPTGTYISTYQDRAGYLWVGTYMAGAARFDGKKWTAFSTKNGLLANRVDQCWQDSLGRRWFDHGQYGLTMLDNDGKFHPFKPSENRRKEIERMVIAPDGQIYFFDHSTRQISRFDPETGGKKSIRLQLPDDTASQSSSLILRNGHNLEGAIFVPRRESGRPT